jgi:carboxymethylenebutenolidase
MLAMPFVFYQTKLLLLRGASTMRLAQFFALPNQPPFVMQKLLFVVLMALAVPGLFMGRYQQPQPSQEPEVLCHGLSGHDAMVALTKSHAFVGLHENPLPFQFETQDGQAVSFKTPDGKEAKGMEWKAKKKSKAYLLVFHEWWGLNGQVKQEAEKLYKDLGEKVNVIALDLYDGQVGDTREDAMKYMQGLSTDRGNAIVQGAMTYAGKKAKFYTIGWCLGGSWSLQASILAGKQGAGCVIYYGRPEKDIEKLKLLNADVLGIFGSQDKGIPPAVAEELNTNLTSIGKKMTYKIFEADHAFANPSNPKYDAKAAGEAYKMTLDFLKARL